MPRTRQFSRGSTEGEHQGPGPLRMFAITKFLATLELGFAAVATLESNVFFHKASRKSWNLASIWEASAFRGTLTLSRTRRYFRGSTEGGNIMDQWAFKFPASLEPGFHSGGYFGNQRIFHRASGQSWNFLLVWETSASRGTLALSRTRQNFGGSTKAETITDQGPFKVL